LIQADHPVDAFGHVRSSEADGSGCPVRGHCNACWTDTKGGRRLEHDRGPVAWPQLGTHFPPACWCKSRVRLRRVGKLGRTVLGRRAIRRGWTMRRYREAGSGDPLT
jgi:hypothetical protein